MDKTKYRLPERSRKGILKKLDDFRLRMLQRLLNANISVRYMVLIELGLVALLLIVLGLYHHL